MSTKDDSFHPLGAEWEEHMTDMLDETEYDTDLGLDMARDAMRVTKGEMSEAEFHEKYHDEVLEEFGVDDRPTEDAFEALQREQAKNRGGFSRAVEAFDEDGDVDRREAMKKFGAAATALGVMGASSAIGEPDGTATAAEESGDAHPREGQKQWGMVIDLERCDGCLSCVQGCQEENGWNPGMNWMYVMAWEDDTTELPEDPVGRDYNFLVRPCQHCTDAPCEKVCPTTARHTRSKDGLVLTDYDVCIGCRYCQVACPYGVNYFQWDEPHSDTEDVGGDDHVYADYAEEGEEEDLRRVDSRAPRGVMSKCTMCPTRQDGNMGEEKKATTACEEACAEAGMNVIHFGDLHDDDSKPNRYLQQRRKEAREQDLDIDLDEEWAESQGSGNTTGELSTFKLMEDIGTNPNVIYIGEEPGAEAEQIPPEDTNGTLTYEDIPMSHMEGNNVDARKEATDEGTLGGDLF